MKTLSKIVVLALLGIALLGGCGPTQPAGSSPLPPTAPAAATARATTVPTQEAPSSLTAGLAGLDFDTFLEASYRRLLLRDPEAVVKAGLVGYYGASKDRLTDISEPYVRETQQLETAVLALLRSYDRAQLTAGQQLSYDIYEWYLDDRVRGHPYAYHDFPVSFLITTSIPKQLLEFFDYFPITSPQDVQDYITCLSQVDDKFDQLIAGLQRREQAGVTPPGFLIPWYLGELQQIARGPARSTPHYTGLAAKVEALGLSAQEQEDLLATARQEIEASVLPAYAALVSYLQHLQTVVSDDIGAWRLSDGAGYYAYTVRHFTTTEMTPEEIHELGKQELVRIRAEMRAIFDQLGYPQDEDLAQLYNRVARDGGMVSGSEVAAVFEGYIRDAEERTAAVFDMRPRAEVIVVAGQEGDYYSWPAVDGSRPGMFYARVSGSQPRYRLPSLTYHETVPGHHYQIALALELPLPSFRKGADFLGYVEGWALYAERLAHDLGFYADDPYGNLGRLQMEAFRAARLVVDTGIHAKQWSFGQAVDFMVENTGMQRQYVESEVARYAMWPGQALAYDVGFLKILELRQKAQDQLGGRFDFKEFHNVLLSNGAVPLDVLEHIVDDYIAANKG